MICIKYVSLSFISIQNFFCLLYIFSVGVFHIQQCVMIRMSTLGFVQITIKKIQQSKREEIVGNKSFFFLL